MTRKLSGKLAELAKIRAARGLLLPQLNEIILADASDEGDRRQDIIHVSEMAKADWCPRATYYRIAGWKVPPEKINLTLENIYEEGNTIHAKWQERMRKTGKLYGLWRCQLCHEWKNCTAAELDTILDPEWEEPDNLTGSREDYCPLGYGEPLAHMWQYLEVHMNVEDTHLITAHADGAMDDFLVEIKSIGMGTLRLDAPKLLSRNYFPLEDDNRKVYDLDSVWKGIRRPLSSHLRQGMLYLWICKQVGAPYNKLVFLYEFKPNQQVKEFTISLNEELIAPLLESALQVKHAIDSIEVYGLPDCPTNGCKYCEGIEALNGDKTALPRRDDAAHGRSQPPGGGEAGRAEDSGRGVGESAGKFTAGSSGRDHHRPRRPADGPVRDDGALDGVPYLAVGSGPGRRVLLRRCDYPAGG